MLLRFTQLWRAKSWLWSAGETTTIQLHNTCLQMEIVSFLRDSIGITSFAEHGFSHLGTALERQVLPGGKREV